MSYEIIAGDNRRHIAL